MLRIYVGYLVPMFRCKVFLKGRINFSQVWSHLIFADPLILQKFHSFISQIICNSSFYQGSLLSEELRTNYYEIVIGLEFSYSMLFRNDQSHITQRWRGWLREVFSLLVDYHVIESVFFLPLLCELCAFWRGYGRLPYPSWYTASGVLILLNIMHWVT